MEGVVFSAVALALGAFFVALGIFAWRRKKPMWFWSGSTVSEREIRDVPAYNRANGIMWLVFSAVFFVSAGLSFVGTDVAGAVLAIGCVGGIPALVFAYTTIYKKYRKNDPRKGE